ncbi:hypothetical protein RhiirA1_395334 [Rhizophagus irregularis]|uniref:Uncharacterized protein n=1 Tax=Rhizophagus irregularis TaxID=588596 RepID=A0A2N0RQ02_9GLOM|nr:hypothetical protein RhiirA1_395334 [Rhizophagus irregularis]
MDVKKENGFNVGDVSPKFKNWAMQTNNFLLLGNKIISHAEQNKILQEYTKLNDDFTHNLKEEHRWTDEKETGEKRPKPVSPKNEIVIARQKQEQKNRTKKKREEVMGEILNNCLLGVGADRYTLVIEAFHVSMDVSRYLYLWIN